jgi:hypothetical protein
MEEGDRMTPEAKAKAWLLSQGYTQFKDGTWSWKGYEADAESVLADYIGEQEG